MNLKSKIRNGFIWITAANIVPAASATTYLLGFSPEGESLPEWFSRAGSVTTIMGLIAEMYAEKFPAQGTILNVIDTEERDALKADYKLLKIAILWTIGWGTLNWGYGDVYLRMFIN